MFTNRNKNVYNHGIYERFLGMEKSTNTFLKRQTSEIRKFILENLQNPRIVTLVVDKFGISRTAVYQNIKKLINEGKIKREENHKKRKYTLVSEEKLFIYSISDGLSESEIWRRDIEEYMPQKDNVRHIWEYGFTEMFNNAIDHSGGTTILVKILFNSIKTSMYVVDNGIGVFRKIKNKFNLSSEREAILELAKGKLTTNAAEHTGEGIFFTSRAFDVFFIESHGIFFSHNDAVDKDVLFEDLDDGLNGTVIYMEIKNDSDRLLSDIFDKFSGEDYGFDKTIIPIELARYGDENLVSRSQAKRVLTRVNLFKNVVFDFKNVPQIGQAFADEIFRVFAKSNPTIKLDYINANEEIVNMIKRALAVNV